MKIHIIGGAGSGKSYCASILALKYQIPHFDLDDLFWNNSSTVYGVKSDEGIRDKKLNEIAAQERWVIEGVYYKWCTPSFERADKIYVLHPPIWLQNFRIVKRFLKRKVKLIPCKKRETASGLIALLKWNMGYNGEKFGDLMEYLEKFKEKVVIVNKSSEILEYF